MKKYKKILVISSFFLLPLLSCEEDRLDQIPYIDSVLDTSLQNEDDLKRFLNGAYDALSASTLFGANMSIYGDLFSDNVFVSNDNDGYFTGENALSISDNTDLGFLGQLYAALNYANIVINNELDENSAIVNMEGEAHIIRGLCLFYAVNLFSSNPTSGQYQEYGVPVYTTDFDPSVTYPRSTVDEVYTQIVSDLQTGIEMMNIQIPENKGYLSPVAAKLLLSRVYLTWGRSADDYQKALDYSNEVINSVTPGNQAGFDFVSSEDYMDYFSAMDVIKTESQPETVWEVNMTATDNPQLNAAIASFYARNGNHASLLFRQEFIDLYGESSDDVRRGLLTNQNVPSVDAPTGFWTTKWPRLTSEGNYTINVKILRMSEAKLNKIEALYHLGQEGTALTELNDFAVSRGGTTYSASNLLDNILTERRKEFFGEGQRFFDLKRNNMGYTKSTNCAGATCTVEANSKFMVFPMPLTTEMLINPLMTQHPLWQ